MSKDFIIAYCQFSQPWHAYYINCSYSALALLCNATGIKNNSIAEAKMAAKVSGT